MAPPDDYGLEAPAAVYVGDAPTPEAKRISNAILNLRPGALIVVAPRSVRDQPRH